MRSATLLEIRLYQCCSLVVAVFLSVIALFWKKIGRLYVITSFFSGRTYVPQIKWYNSIFNPSLYFLSTATLLFFIYILSAKIILDQAIIDIIDKENGIIETGSAFFNFTAAVLCLILLQKENKPNTRIFLMVMAIVFICFTGEEINWGQNFLHWSTPAVFKIINVQNETNFHNLFGYFTDHLCFFSIVVYCSILPLVSRISPLGNVIVNKLGIVLPSLGLCAGFMLISLLQKRMIWTLFPSSYKMRVVEIREFLFAIGLFLIFIEYYFVRKKTKLTE